MRDLLCFHLGDEASAHWAADTATSSAIISRCSIGYSARAGLYSESPIVASIIFDARVWSMGLRVGLMSFVPSVRILDRDK